MRAWTLRLFALATAAAAFATPAAAQPPSADPEWLAGASVTPDTGLPLARSQIADRDLLGAAGTLERVLLAHPEANGARLLYASVLCRLDDPEGAGLELRLLGGQPIADADWADVTAACGNVPRPAPPKGRRR
jgi:hypothetical protein